MPESIDLQVRQLINTALHGVAKAALDKSKEFAPVFTGKLKASGKLVPETFSAGRSTATEFTITYDAYNAIPAVTEQLGQYSYGDAASYGISASETTPDIEYKVQVYKSRPYTFPQFMPGSNGTTPHPRAGEVRPPGIYEITTRNYVPVTGLDGSIRFLNPKGPRKENLSSPEFLEDAVIKVFDDTFGTSNGLTRFGTNWSVRV